MTRLQWDVVGPITLIPSIETQNLFGVGSVLELGPSWPLLCNFAGQV
jgi:hypothetical protein